MRARLAIPLVLAACTADCHFPADAADVSDGGARGDGSTDGGAGGRVYFIGRFDTHDPGGPRFSWPGSQIIARFSGTGIDVELTDQGTNFFDVVIDDAAPTVLSTDNTKQTYQLATGLTGGEHTVLLEKRTESQVGVVQFGGFIPQGGALVPSAPPARRGIELVGDSITCGFGNEGTTPCAVSSSKEYWSTENEFLAYGAIAARSLGAAHVGISYSGIGVFRNVGGDRKDVMPARYERTLADDGDGKWDFSWTPDVVVINLGTNDFATGDPGQPYLDAMTAFIKQVRGHYPSVFIICAMLYFAPAQAALQSVVQAANDAGDARVAFLDLGDLSNYDPNDGMGCNNHPTVATHQKMAAKLTAAITSLTGW